MEPAYLGILLQDDVIKWKHISALLALCEGNPPVSGGFPSKRASDTGFDAFFDVSLKDAIALIMTPL